MAETAPNQAVIKLWCHKCKDFVPYQGHKDAVGAYHVDQAEVNAHRAVH